MKTLANIKKENSLGLLNSELENKVNGTMAIVNGIEGDKFIVEENTGMKEYSFTGLQRNFKMVVEEPFKVLESNEEVIMETQNEGIFDNIKEKQGKVNITGHIYGVPVKADNINQTTMWKVLMKLYKNRKEENDIYPTEQKVLCVKTLREIDEETFEGAYRCLVSKTKKEYIDSLLNA